MNAWEKYAPDEVLYDGHQRVTLKHFRSEDGGVFDFETVGFSDKNAATVLALTPDNIAIVTKQFRVGPEAIMWECVSGAIEKDEEPIVAAARELREETGYESHDISYLGTAYDSPYSNMKRHFFFAKKCIKTGTPTPDELERIEVELITIKQLIKNAKSGKMTNGLAVLFAYDNLMELEKKS